MKDHPILISENFDAAVALCARHTTTAQRFTNLPHAAAFHVPICKGTFFTARQKHVVSCSDFFLIFLKKRAIL
jgi:hypothetical protein